MEEITDRVVRQVSVAVVTVIPTDNTHSNNNNNNKNKYKLFGFQFQFGNKNILKNIYAYIKNHQKPYSDIDSF